MCVCVCLCVYVCLRFIVMTTTINSSNYAILYYKTCEREDIYMLQFLLPSHPVIEIKLFISSRTTANRCVSNGRCEQ